MAKRRNSKAKKGTVHELFRAESADDLSPAAVEFLKQHPAILSLARTPDISKLALETPEAQPVDWKAFRKVWDAAAPAKEPRAMSEASATLVIYYQTRFNDPKAKINKAAVGRTAGKIFHFSGEQCRQELQNLLKEKAKLEEAKPEDREMSEKLYNALEGAKNFFIFFGLTQIVDLIDQDWEFP